MKKIAQIISCLLIAIMIVCGSSPVVFASGVDGDNVHHVKAYMPEGEPKIELIPGTTTHVSIPVKVKFDFSVGNTSISSVIPTVNISNEEKMTIKDVTLVRSVNPLNQNVLSSNDPTYVEFDVATNATAKIGQYFIEISFTSMYDEWICDNKLKIPCYINKELEEPELGISAFTYDKKKAMIGRTLDLNVTIRNDGDLTALNGTLNVDYGDSGLKAEYSTSNIKIGDLKGGNSTTITIPTSIVPTATKGTKKLTINYNCKDEQGNPITGSTEVYVDVKEVEKAPQLSFSKVEYKGSLLAGDSFDLIATITNKGDAKAKKIKVSLAEGASADGIMPKSSESYISVNDMNKNETAKVTISLKSSKEATKGAKALKLSISYLDEAGVAYSTETVVYPVIEVKKEEEKEKEEEEGVPNLIIKNVSQSPAYPQAGQRVTVSFEVENKGTIKVEQFKIGPSGLTGETFTPVKNDPYTYIDEIDAGSKKSVTMVFDVTKKIPEGYNTIPISYTYKYGKKNTEETKDAILGILNVINDQDDDLSKSVPKLIISSYDTDPQSLRAGDIFNFHYDIKNTHNSVAAKNIKITVSQADGIFTATGGSNSFYIDKILPGEAMGQIIELKAKADATTKSYPMTITMQYEYDGAVASPVTGKVGEEVVETINLFVAENCRPMATNLYVDQSMGCNVNESTMLYLDFYNMGKGPLANVSMTVSGDFCKTDGDQQIVGLVNAGEVQNVEIEVTPLIEGEAVGVLTISYEDSNGERLEMEPITFTSFVSGGYNDMPIDFDPSIFEPVVEEKKPIVPVWAFVVIQVVIFLVGLLVTRAIVIKRYKKKLEKQYED